MAVEYRILVPRNCHNVPTIVEAKRYLRLGHRRCCDLAAGYHQWARLEATLVDVIPGTEVRMGESSCNRLLMLNRHCCSASYKGFLSLRGGSRMASIEESSIKSLN